MLDPNDKADLLLSDQISDWKYTPKHKNLFETPKKPRLLTKRSDFWKQNPVVDTSIFKKDAINKKFFSNSVPRYNLDLTSLTSKNLKKEKNSEKLKKSKSMKRVKSEDEEEIDWEIWKEAHQIRHQGIANQQNQLPLFVESTLFTNMLRKALSSAQLFLLYSKEPYHVQRKSVKKDSQGYKKKTLFGGNIYSKQNSHVGIKNQKSLFDPQNELSEKLEQKNSKNNIFVSKKNHLQFNQDRKGKILRRNSFSSFQTNEDKQQSSNKDSSSNVTNKNTQTVKKSTQTQHYEPNYKIKLALLQLRTQIVLNLFFDGFKHPDRNVQTVLKLTDASCHLFWDIHPSFNSQSLIEHKVNYQRNTKQKCEQFHKLVKADKAFCLFQKITRSTSMRCLTQGLRYAIHKHVSFHESTEAYSALISLATTYLLQMNSPTSNLSLQSKNIYNSQMLCKHCKLYRRVFVCNREGKGVVSVVEYPFWFNKKDFFHLVCYLTLKRQNKLKEIQNFTITKRSLLYRKYGKRLGLAIEH